MAISIQYKATHPLWGMQEDRSVTWRKVNTLDPKPLTPAILMNLMQDFRGRIDIPKPVWEAMLADEMVTSETVLDLGLDSYVDIRVEPKEFTKGEWAGMTVQEVLRGMQVRLALEDWGQ